MEQHTLIGICLASYVDCLLARSGWNSTVIGICLASYVDCLLARSGWNSTQL